MKEKKKLWFAVFVVLAIASAFAVTQQSKSFSLSGFSEYLHNADQRWIALAFVCMLGYITFEGLSLLHLSGSLGYPRRLGSGIVYSAADLFFSAITPSATGGQPASAICMMKDGIPAAVTTVVLLLNLMMYTVSILVIGLLCAVLRPGVFLHFGLLSRVLIVVGAAVQGGLTAVFLLLVFRERLALRLANGVLSLLSKLHLVREVDAKRARLEEIGAEYHACADAISANKRMLWRAFAYNLLQRLSVIFVSVCVFLSVGGRPGAWLDVWATQSMVILGSNVVPVPGAVGVADFLYLDGFASLIGDTVSIELLSRGISFYCCIILCGLIAWGWFALRRRN
jgi:hypothetical protein